MVRHLLTVNPGSSTIKLGVYRLGEDGSLTACCRAMIDRQIAPLALQVHHDNETVSHPLPGDVFTGPALTKILAILAQAAGAARIDAVGHRVVHGGDRFQGPVRIDDGVIDALRALVPLAPLHQPQSVHLITALRDLLPGLPQTASFDTAFHHSQAAATRRFALPRELFDAGIKRYGFHGLSYAYIAGLLRRRAPALADGRVVVAHLGSGASLCALAGGVSRDCSMGFSTLDGIPMATRSGSLDPGVILHLMTQRGLSLPDVEDMLYHRAGLLGLSGLSGDTRRLLASPEPAAREAIAVFMLRVAREIAAQATTLGGLDGIVFTAGIGEHQAQIRAGILAHLGWLGVVPDDAANAVHDWRISASASRVQVLVLATDEEQIIAEEAAGLLPAAG